MSIETKTIHVVCPLFTPIRALICWMINRAYPGQVHFHRSQPGLKRYVRENKLNLANIHLVLMGVADINIPKDDIEEFGYVTVFQWRKHETTIKDLRKNPYASVIAGHTEEAWRMFCPGETMPLFINWNTQEDPETLHDWDSMDSAARQTLSDSYDRTVRVCNVLRHMLIMSNEKYTPDEALRITARFAEADDAQLEHFDALAAYAHAVRDEESRQVARGADSRVIGGISIPCLHITPRRIMYTEKLHLLKEHGAICVYHTDFDTRKLSGSVIVKRASVIDMDALAAAVQGKRSDTNPRAIHIEFNFMDEPHRFPLA